MPLSSVALASFPRVSFRELAGKVLSRSSSTIPVPRNMRHLGELQVSLLTVLALLIFCKHVASSSFGWFVCFLKQSSSCDLRLTKCNYVAKIGLGLSNPPASAF